MSKDKYVGMDVDKATVVTRVMDKDGKNLSEATIVLNGEALKDYVRGIGGTVHLTFEEGTQAAWLYDLLKPYVSELIVCDPRYNKRYGESKTDKLDARRLADLLRTKSLKAVYHGEKSTKSLKELAQSYETIVSDSVRVMNRIKAIYRGRAISCSGRSVYDGQKREQWLLQLKEPGMRKRAELLYRELDHLKELRRESKEALIKESRKHKLVKLLLTVPGLGSVRAAEIMAIVAYPQRFGNKRQFWSYCGLSVREHSSGDQEIKDGVIRKKKGKNTRGLIRCYNRQLKMIMK